MKARGVVVMMVVGCSASPPPLTPPVFAIDSGLPLDDGGHDADVTDTMPPVDSGPSPVAKLTATWTPFGARNADSRWGTPFAYDPNGKRFLLFGGEGAASADQGTLALSMASGTWTPIADTNAPGPRYEHCATFLPKQNQLLIVGGRNDVGLLPAGAWTLALATGAWKAVTGDLPNGGLGCMASYMPNLDRAIVFGGADMSGYLAETWSYDPALGSFTRLSPTTAPPARADGVLDYDPGDGGRLLLFSGTQDELDGAMHFNDLWAFDGKTWTQLQPSGGPPPARRAAAHGFDPARRTWLIFGGTDEMLDYGDTWVLDAERLQWFELPKTGALSARGFASSGYDPSTDSYAIIAGLQQPSHKALTDGYKLVLH